MLSLALLHQFIQYLHRLIGEVFELNVELCGRKLVEDVLKQRHLVVACFHELFSSVRLIRVKKSGKVFVIIRTDFPVDTTKPE